VAETFYTEVIHSAHAFRDFDTMTDNRRNQAGFHHVFATGREYYSIAVAMLLGACTTPVPAPATVRNRHRRNPASETRRLPASRLGIKRRVNFQNDAAERCSRRIAPHRKLAGRRSRWWNFQITNVRMPRISRSDLPAPEKGICGNRHGAIRHKDMPLKSIHPQALPAAVGPLVAPVCRTFWPMHDALYANPGRCRRNCIETRA